MKSILVSLILMFAAMAPTTPEPVWSQSGKGATSLTVPLNLVAEGGVLQWESVTRFGYTSVEIQDEAGNVLADFWGFGYIFLNREITLDPSQVVGETLTVAVSGTQTDYEVYLLPNANR